MNLKLDLSNFITSTKQFAIIFIDFESLKTVSDVICYICQTFEIEISTSEVKKGSENFSLYEDIYYIPNNQSSYIFKDIKGVIRLFADVEITKNFTFEPTEEKLDIKDISNNSQTLIDNIENLQVAEVNPELNIDSVTCESELAGTLQDVSENYSDHTSLTEDAIDKKTFKIKEYSSGIEISTKNAKNNNYPLSKINESSALREASAFIQNDSFVDISQDVCSSEVKRKRKRKHNKRKKADKLRVQNTSRISNGYSNVINKPKYLAKKTFDYASPNKKAHKIFEDSDESQDDASKLSDHTDNKPKVSMPVASESICSNFNSDNDQDQIDSSFTSHMQHKHKIIEKSQDLSVYSVAVNDKTTTKPQPPVVPYDIPEISSEVRHKFRNLLNLESRFTPKIFTVNRNSRKPFQNQQYSGEWNALPLAFGSKSQRNIIRSENERIELNCELPNDIKKSSAEFNINNGGSKHSSDVNSFASESKTSPTHDSFIGSKPPRRNKRYFQSIGNTLKALKNAQSSLEGGIIDKQIDDTELLIQTPSLPLTDTKNRNKKRVFEEESEMKYSCKNKKEDFMEYARADDNILEENDDCERMKLNDQTSDSNLNINQTPVQSRYTCQVADKMQDSTICTTEKDDSHCRLQGSISSSHKTSTPRYPFGPNDGQNFDPDSSFNSKNHLNFESNLGVKSCLREKEYIISSQNSQDLDGSYSLPLSFASKNRRNRMRNEREKVDTNISLPLPTNKDNVSTDIYAHVASNSRTTLEDFAKSGSDNKHLIIGKTIVNEENQTTEITEDTIDSRLTSTSLNYNFNFQNIEEEDQEKFHENLREEQISSATESNVNIPEAKLDGTETIYYAPSNGQENISRNIENCQEKNIDDHLEKYSEPISKNLSSDKVMKNSNLLYDSYPVLLALPKEGDIIATKILKLDTNLCPYYSEYRPAKVISLNGLRLQLQFLDEIDNASKEKIVSIENNQHTEVDWRDLKFTRLIFP